MGNDSTLAIRMQARVGYSTPVGQGSPMRFAVTEHELFVPRVGYSTHENRPLQTLFESLKFLRDCRYMDTPAVKWLTRQTLGYIVHGRAVRTIGQHTQYNTLSGFSIKVDCKYEDYLGS